MKYTEEQLLPKLSNYRIEIRLLEGKQKYCVVNNYTGVVEFNGEMLPEIIPVLYHLEAGLDATMDMVQEGAFTSNRMRYAVEDDEDIFEDEEEELLRLKYKGSERLQ